MKALLYIFSLLLFTHSFGQADSNIHRSSSASRIKDGIYLSFKQLRQNKPISKESVLTQTHQYLCYYKELLRHEFISYTNHQSEVCRVSTDSILGYAIDGAFYLFNSNDHVRLHLDGAVAFVGIRPSWEQKKSEASLTHASSENTRSSGKAQSNRISGIDEFSGGFYYASNFNMGYMPEADFELKTIYEYLVDFEKDSIMEFSHKSLKLILKRDPELYKEYVSLSSSKQKKMEVVFLRRYNERHPFAHFLKEKDVVGF